MAAESSWQTLSPAILAPIVGRLSLPDRARFASVCSSFRSAAADVASTVPFPPHLPYLFLYSPSSFFDLSDPRTYPTPVPTPADRFLLASSSNGLLLTVSTSHHLNLLHPFTRSHFPLPPLFPPDPSSSLSLVDLLMVYSKAAVSWRTPSSFAIVMIVNSGLALARLVLLRDGDPCWQFLGSQTQNDDGSSSDCVLYYDLAVFKKSVVALRFDGKVDTWDLRERSPMARVMVGDHDMAIMNSMELLMVQRYLVVAMRGELLLQVWRLVDDATFRVFMMDSEKGKWVEVAGLGSQILFLGRYGSMAVDASDFENLRKNCIYYCHLEEEKWECSVYCLGEKNERQWFYKPQRDVRPPLWVMPSLE